MRKSGHSSLEDLPRPCLPEAGDLLELYDFAWSLARKHIAFMPGLASESYMDEGFEPGKIWQWDSCFMAMFCRYAYDLFPGVESLDNLYSFQRGDGYISMSHKIPSGEDSYPLPNGRINPPLYAWTEWESYKVSGDLERLARILPSLLKYDSWIELNRRRRDGSYWFEDGGSSGMDNSPRAARRNKAGNDVSYVDLASQQALSALNISQIAGALGDLSLTSEYAEKHEERVSFINSSLWCEKSCLYLDKLPEGTEFERYEGYFSACKSIASFWPMLAGAVPSNRVDGLVSHLFNEQEFKSINPVPSLSRDNPNYHPSGRYWQGGVWAPTNYMVVKGLRKCGRHEVARGVALSYLDMLAKVWRDFEPHTLWECYSPEFPEPARNERGELSKPDFVGWTGLGPIAMFIEDVIGLEVDYPNRKIVWRSPTISEHGVKNLRFGPHRISVMAKTRDSSLEMPEIETESPCDLKVEFIPMSN